MATNHEPLKIPFPSMVFSLSIVPIQAESMLRVFASLPRASYGEGVDPMPNYTLNETGSGIASRFRLHDCPPLAVIIDDNNGFLEINDRCHTAIAGNTRYQIALFTSNSTNLIIRSVVTFHGLGPWSLMQIFKRVGQEMEEIPTQLSLPTIPIRSFLLPEFPQRTIDFLLSHKSLPYFVYSLPRVGTDIVVDLEMHEDFECPVEALCPKELRESQRSFRSAISNSILLHWDTTSSSFIYTGNKGLRTRFPVATSPNTRLHAPLLARQAGFGARSWHSSQTAHFIRLFASRGCARFLED